MTTRDPRDMKYLRQCLENDIPSTDKAGLVPTGQHIETFSETVEEYGLGQGEKELHQILERFNELANVKSDYFLCRQSEMVDIARHMAGIDLDIVSSTWGSDPSGLTHLLQPSKYLMCLCPMNVDNKGSVALMKRFAAKLAAGEVCGLNQATVPKSPKSFEGTVVRVIRFMGPNRFYQTSHVFVRYSANWSFSCGFKGSSPQETSWNNTQLIHGVMMPFD